VLVRYFYWYWNLEYLSPETPHGGVNKHARISKIEIRSTCLIK
jgi:hypothetical protein